MQHFFIAPGSFAEKTVMVTEPRLIHQIKNVLRMQPGDQCVFLDNSGFEFLSEITRLDEKEITATVLEKRKNLAEPALFVTLCQALPKKMELFEWILQKGTEIGVSAFVPLITERTERREIPKCERMEKILKEAAEQCERGKIPELAPIQKFPEALIHSTGRQKILLHGRGDYPLFSKNIIKQSSINIFVGPEGGFTENELTKAKKHECTIASLGPRVLRTETAGMVAASLIAY